MSCSLIDTPGLTDDAVADVGNCKLLLSRSFLDDGEGNRISTGSSSPLPEITASSSVLCPFEIVSPTDSPSTLHSALRLCQKLSKSPLPEFPVAEFGSVSSGNALGELLQLFCSKKDATLDAGRESQATGQGAARIRCSVMRNGDVSHGHLSDAAFTRMCETGELPSPPPAAEGGGLVHLRSRSLEQGQTSSDNSNGDGVTRKRRRKVKGDDGFRQTDDDVWICPVSAATRASQMLDTGNWRVMFVL
jgi:hypothetical protein